MSEKSTKKRGHESDAEDSADSNDEWVGPKATEIEPNEDEQSENSNSQQPVILKKRKSNKKDNQIKYTITYLKK